MSRSQRDRSQETGILHALFWRQYGNASWDGILRGSAVLVVLAMPLTVFVPEAGGVVGFALITMWLNGPLSPVFPSTYEPILMLFGRVYQPLLVASVGVAGIIFVEYLNYHLYRRVVRIAALERMRASRTVRWVVRLFSRAPFLAVWLCSWSILPYWPVRFISPLAGYDLRRHLLATFLGRFPRLWFFAALGVWWNVSLRLLFLISVGSILIALAVFWVRHVRGRRAREVSEAAEVARLNPVES